jgi:hypothetical protein
MARVSVQLQSEQRIIGQSSERCQREQSVQEVRAQYIAHLHEHYMNVSLSTLEDTRRAFVPVPALVSSPRHTLDHLGVCLGYHLEQPRTPFGENPMSERSSASRLVSLRAASQKPPKPASLPAEALMWRGKGAGTVSRTLGLRPVRRIWSKHPHR